MASYVRNIRIKNYQHLIIDFQVTVENVGDVFGDTVYNDCTQCARIGYCVRKASRPLPVKIMGSLSLKALFCKKITLTLTLIF